jgi:hypothetical protein
MLFMAVLFNFTGVSFQLTSLKNMIRYGKVWHTLDPRLDKVLK